MENSRKKHNGGGHSGHMPSGGKALMVSGWLTGVYFFIELGIGLWTGSVAVISDAFHTFSAVGGVVVAIIARRVATRAADGEKTFGYHRAELIGALTNGAFLLIMALIVIVMGLMRLGQPIDIPSGPMFWAAAGGLFTEVVSLYMMRREKGDDLNMKGAYWHIIQTFVGSLIIIVAALVIKFTGFMMIDPILGTAFGFVLLWVSIGILRESTHLLMEGTPEDVDLDASIAALGAIKGVENVHHVHSWALTSGRNVFSGHLKVDKRADTAEILKLGHKTLADDFSFYFVTLQLETECLDEAGAAEIDVAGSGKNQPPPSHADHRR